MAFQIDGTFPLNQQELQLQSIETFFVEVVDYQAGAGGRNDVMTRPVSAPVSLRINLTEIPAGGTLSGILGGVTTIVFDRIVLVGGIPKRVVGSRT